MLKVPIRLTRTTFSKSPSGVGAAVLADDADRIADAGAVDEDARGAVRRFRLGERRGGGRVAGDVADDGHAADRPGDLLGRRRLRSATATFAPLAASASAVARPSPDPPPVTIAAAPEIFIAPSSCNSCLCRA